MFNQLKESSPENIIKAPKGSTFTRTGEDFYLTVDGVRAKLNIPKKSFALEYQDEIWYSSLTEDIIAFETDGETWRKIYGDGKKGWVKISNKTSTVLAIDFPTPTPNLTLTPTPSITPTLTPTPSITPTFTPTQTPSITPTLTPTLTPTNSPLPYPYPPEYVLLTVANSNIPIIYRGSSGFESGASNYAVDTVETRNPIPYNYGTAIFVNPPVTLGKIIVYPCISENDATFSGSLDGLVANGLNSVEFVNCNNMRAISFDNVNINNININIENFCTSSMQAIRFSNCNLSGSINFTAYDNLTYLYVENNGTSNGGNLQSVDISGLAVLDTVWFSNNDSLTYINASGCTYLLNHLDGSLYDKLPTANPTASATLELGPISNTGSLSTATAKNWTVNYTLI